MEKSSPDSSDSDGRLCIVEDEFEISPSSSSSRAEFEDYVIDIVDSIDGYEVHVESLSQEELDKDVVNLIKENADIDIMSLPFVFSNDISKNVNEGAISKPAQNGSNGSNGSVVKIPFDDSRIERTVPKKIVSAGSVSPQTVNNKLRPLHEVSSKSQTKGKENKKKYYICFEEDCLFNKRFGRFDTKQKFKTHLWNEHWVRDKDKLNRKANRSQAIIRNVSLKNDSPAPLEKQDIRGKKDKPAKRKGAIKKTVEFIKKAKKRKAEVENAEKLNSTQRCNLADLDVFSKEPESESTRLQKPAVSFVCTRDDCITSNFPPSFETELDFKNHIRLCHSKINLDRLTETKEEKPIYECKSCDILFESKKDLETHEFMHGLNDPLTCKICNVQFKSTDQLNWHKEDKHSERMYKCEKCISEFRFRFQLIQHLRSMHSNEMPVLCPICDKGFRLKTELKDHAEEVHKVKVESYICDKCDRLFNSKKGLAIHFAHAHMEEDKGRKKGVGKKKSVGKKKKAGKKRTTKLIKKQK